MNLHNLLWIYAADQSAPNPSMFYPGDDYVDIVALDAYVDDPVGIENRRSTFIRKVSYR